MTPPETNQAEQSLILPPETWAGLRFSAPALESPLIWNCPFVLPGWLKSWWTCFHEDWVPYLWALKRGGRWLGLAPVMLRGEEARFMGSAEVCDHLDFVLSPGEEDHFLEIFLTNLRDRGIRALNLFSLRQDSQALPALSRVAEKLGLEHSLHQAGVVMEMPLPSSWEAFLEQLNGKQRHEIRRKERRLREAGDVRCRLVDTPEAVRQQFETFLDLFRLNRADKKAFLTDPMTCFFRSLAENLTAAGILELFFLELDGRPVAALMCFDCRDTLYLYNNGYDGRWGFLSVGLLSKVFSIKEAIRRGKKNYSFLKGDEEYKLRLGASPVQLYQCRIAMDRG